MRNRRFGRSDGAMPALEGMPVAAPRWMKVRRLRSDTDLMLAAHRWTGHPMHRPEQFCGSVQVPRRQVKPEANTCPLRHPVRECDSLSTDDGERVVDAGNCPQLRLARTQARSTRPADGPAWLEMDSRALHATVMARARVDGLPPEPHDASAVDESAIRRARSHCGPLSALHPGRMAERPRANALRHDAEPRQDVGCLASARLSSSVDHPTGERKAKAHA